MRKKRSVLSLLVLATMMLLVVSSCSVKKTGKAFSWDAGIDQNIYNLAALASNGQGSNFKIVVNDNYNIQAVTPLASALQLETVSSEDLSGDQKDLIIVSTDNSLASGEAIITLDTTDGTKLLISSSSSEGTAAAVSALVNYKDHPQLKSTKVKVLADAKVEDLTGKGPGDTPVTAKAKIKITTDPLTADIYLNNQLKGSTTSGELVIADLDAGTYEVKVSSSGYQDSVISGLEVSAGADITLNKFVLEKVANACTPDYSDCSEKYCAPDGKKSKICYDKKKCVKAPQITYSDCTPDSNMKEKAIIEVDSPFWTQIWSDLGYGYSGALGAGMNSNSDGRAGPGDPVFVLVPAGKVIGITWQETADYQRHEELVVLKPGERLKLSPSLSSFISIKSGDCVQNWICERWSTCTNGKQTRTCNDIRKCGVTTAKPLEPFSCTATCIPDYSSCTTTTCGSDSKQTKTCTDKNNCGESAKVEIVSCTYIAPCTADYSDPALCTLTACGSDGKQTKTCADKNSCAGSSPQVTTVSCTYIAPCTSDWQVKNTGECQPNGAQTVTYEDKKACDPAKLTKTESKSCTYVAPCQTTWNVESEGACDAGTQTKKITYVDSCKADNKKTEIQSCSYTCTEKDWTCTGSIDATTCKYDELLKRDCTSSVKLCSDSNTAKPLETYQCVPKCAENWESTQTEECRSDGNQGIAWADKNACGTTYKKPVQTAQKCTYVSTQGTIGFKSYDGVTVSYGLEGAGTPKLSIAPSVSGKEGIIEYVIPNLEPGTYELTTELNGYESDTRTVLVEKGKTTEAGEIKLTPLISTAFKNIKDKKQYDSYNIVIGALADPSDNIGALDIAGGHRISKTELDTQIELESTKNLIVIGGPCANFETGRLMGRYVDEKYYWTLEGKASEKCAEGFELGKGFVQLFKEGETVKIVIAGYSATDTRRLAKVIRKITDNADKFKGKKIEVCGESIDDVRYDCKNFKLDPAKLACKKAKGEWKEFSNTCADSCELAANPSMICAEVLITSCECGLNKCWNGRECVANPVTIAAKTGTLAITAVRTGSTTAVSGVAITVDGQLKTETTPATITLNVGPHKVKLTKTGYEDSAETLTEVKEGDNSVQISIKKVAKAPPPPPPPPTK